MSHKRQFLISKKKFNSPDFLTENIERGYFLSFHKDLNVSFSDCKSTILLGIAFKSIPGSISSDLNSITEKNYLTKTSNWSGRWILIINHKVFLDPSGMLGCYYGEYNNAMLISSSLSLINEGFVFERDNNYEDIVYGKMMNWFPPPLTVYKGVKKLLVGQKLNLAKQTIEPIKVKGNSFINFTDAELFSELATRLSHIIKNICEQYKENTYLPLTGGYDSRTILAAFLHNQLSFSSFIFEHEKISQSDKKTPLILSKMFDFPFFSIKRNSHLNTEKYNEYIAFSSGQAKDAGVFFYAHDQYGSLNRKAHTRKQVIVRGGVWELGRKIYTTAGIDESLTSESEILENFKECFPIIKESRLHEKSIILWIKHTLETDSNLGLKDRFYLEQRVSGWLAALEQAADLTDFDRVHPANCQDIIDLLTLCKKHPQTEIIKILKPELLKVKFNNKSVFELLMKVFTRFKSQFNIK